MADEHDTIIEKKTVVTSDGIGGVGTIIASIALLIAVLGILKYFGMLPF